MLREIELLSKSINHKINYRISFVNIGIWSKMLAKRHNDRDDRRHEENNHWLSQQKAEWNRFRQSATVWKCNAYGYNGNKENLIQFTVKSIIYMIQFEPNRNGAMNWPKIPNSMQERVFLLTITAEPLVFKYDSFWPLIHVITKTLYFRMFSWIQGPWTKHSYRFIWSEIW